MYVHKVTIHKLYHDTVQPILQTKFRTNFLFSLFYHYPFFIAFIILSFIFLSTVLQFYFSFLILSLSFFCSHFNFYNRLIKAWIPYALSVYQTYAAYFRKFLKKELKNIDNREFKIFVNIQTHLNNFRNVMYVVQDKRFDLT